MRFLEQEYGADQAPAMLDMIQRLGLVDTDRRIG
ncbi:hypothetical protein J2Z66_005877 [Paenibacillus eucommiae]|uniref:Uncharacterized protein n=1 Tax=Paenibacillus eucommiae TaxID=1355755 RepID=A0ABS4J557_9BACL|nr:hypothetical protein [Paenibacillus eucommiae]